jgi:hypothetical protein
MDVLPAALVTIATYLARWWCRDIRGFPDSRTPAAQAGKAVGPAARAVGTAADGLTLRGVLFAQGTSTNTGAGDESRFSARDPRMRRARHRHGYGERGRVMSSVDDDRMHPYRSSGCTYRAGGAVRCGIADVARPGASADESFAGCELKSG